LTSTDEFLDFLFSASDLKYADLKAMAQQQEDLPKFALKGVSVTFDLDADYQVVNTRYTRNVVGVVEGSDAWLRYVCRVWRITTISGTAGVLPMGRRIGSIMALTMTARYELTLSAWRAFLPRPQTRRRRFSVARRRGERFPGPEYYVTIRRCH
jgi:hypothetical protein